MSQTLNQKVILWASGKLGQHVGAARECWDLANSALKQAGASTSSDFGPTGDDDDYVWGDEVSDLKDVIAGDILQYRDYVQTTATTTDVTFSDDSGWVDDPSVDISHGHHTSIVSRNPGNGALTVLEQNDMGNHETVKSTQMRWKDAATKTTTTKKMMKRQDTGKMEWATVIVTVDVTVTGTIKAYRPTVN
jgi:hypothetical protein